MNYNLVNPNFKENYIENLINFRGGNFNLLKNFNKDNLIDPKLLLNIDIGSNLLIDKIQNKDDKFIHFIVDCDVDGFTSSAILWLYIKKIAPETQLSFQVHTHKQHGLEDMIESLEDRNDIKLLIIPDAGSSDYEYHERLKASSIPILILDHHETNIESKDAIIINNQISKDYENKDLTGAGIVYQFCRYLDSKLNVNFADDFIDLAALGIISDMGSILSLENNYIINKGLKKENKNNFFEALLQKQSYSIGDLNKINYIDIAFYITPLINALIRVGTIIEKENLFLSFVDGKKIVPSTKRGEKGLTETIITQTVRNCINAKERQNRIKDKAISKIEIDIFNQELDKNKILIIQLDETDDFPSELNGLLAMQLSSLYNMPTLVLRKNEDNFLRGSARGINNSELKSFKDYLESTKLFEYCTGHPNAFGSSIKFSDIKNLIKRSNEDLKDYNFNVLSYDINFIRDVNDNDLSELVFDICNNNDIYGQNNPEPLLLIKNINIDFNKDIQIIGKDFSTLKFEKNGITFIKFKDSNIIEDFKKIGNFSLEIIGKANINEWNGNKKPQIFIEDYNLYNSLLDF